MMEVLFNPTPAQTVSGLTSSITWNNPDVEKAMRILFNCQASEQLTTLEVTEAGLTARLCSVSKPIETVYNVTRVPPPR